MRFLIFAIALIGFSTLTPAQELRLIALDVGEGQAILLQHGERGDICLRLPTTEPVTHCERQ